MRSHPRYRVDQPPGAARPSTSVFLSTSLELLWTATAPHYDGARGQVGSLGTPATILPAYHTPGRGLAFGDSTTSTITWSNRPTTSTKYTFSMVIVPTASASTQVVFWNNSGAGAGTNLQLNSTGTTFLVSGGSNFGSTTLALGVPYWLRGSFDEATDEFWILATSLLDGSTVTTTGTSTGTATAGDGTWNLGGRSDGGTTSCNSPILVFSWDQEFTPLALGYAWQNPWEMFEPIDILQSAAGFVTHTSTGVLTAGAATLAGTATHLTLHTSTGILVADAATLAGTAVHSATGTHTTTGSLVADSASLAGVAAHFTLHTSSGVLVAGSALVAGLAQNGTAVEVPQGNFGWDAVRAKRRLRLEGLRKELEDLLDPPTPVGRPLTPSAPVSPPPKSERLEAALRQVEVARQAVGPKLSLNREIAATRQAIEVARSDYQARERKRRNLYKLLMD